MSAACERSRLRVLRFLARGGARLVLAGDGKALLLDGGERGCISVAAGALRALAGDGLVELGDGEVRPRPEAAAHLKRSLSGGDDRFARQHGDWARAPGQAGDEAGFEINLSESPLAVLARLKDRSGAAYLRPAEIRAGERLRADFSFGQLAPRLGVNWQAPITPGAGGAGGGAAGIADSVVAARQRVNHALRAVGPELAGVLVDVCCFLKGLGTVEAERGWPARSAKLLLRTALAALARHYEPPRQPVEAKGPAIRHWGAEGYRPSLAGDGS
jgi:hypothetical protein